MISKNRKDKELLGYMARHKGVLDKSMVDEQKKSFSNFILLGMSLAEEDICVQA